MQDVFERLKCILEPYRCHFAVKTDTADHVYLETRGPALRGKPLFFAAVQINKAYVAFHLMPVYVNPDLLEGTSDDLLARMQGKSCFNFRKADETLFIELEALTQRGFADYQGRGFVAREG